MANINSTIDYTSYDFNVLKDELISYLQETGSFKDANFVSSNINTLVGIVSYIGSLFGYYINSAANEVYLPTAKRYKNLNKLAELLRYDARGKVSATVDVIGSLNAEYVFGKSGQYIDIPAYSLFPSKQAATDGTQFSFTNSNSVVHMVTSYGIRNFLESDFSYNGYSLPFVAAKSFWTDDQTDTGNVIINPILLQLPLTIQKPLSIIVTNPTNADNYKGFDTTNYPLFNPADNQSVGQPFTKNVTTYQYTNTMVPNTLYYVVFNFDKATSSPYMTIVSDITNLGDKQSDVLCSIILEPTDSTNTFYKLRVAEFLTANRFYLGVTGLDNLESATWEFDEITDRPGSVEKIYLTVNKDGNSPPLGVLINGKIYTFSIGRIASQTFQKDFFDSSINEYNINLVIENEDPIVNYGARLEVTSNEPLSNQVTIGKINTQFTDSTSDIQTLVKSPGKKFGDFQIVTAPPVLTSTQKAGRVYFKSSETVQQILFNEPFVLEPGETVVDYHISLTPDNNVRTWWSNKSENGFFVYVEPSTDFQGYVNWIATKINAKNLISIPVAFDEPISTTVVLGETTSNYMVQLTPNDNVLVWYDNLTTKGFNIKAELNFSGKVSWSVYNFFSDNSVPNEVESGYRQRGQVKLSGDTLTSGITVTLDTKIPDESYAIQLIPNKNVNVFYNNKTESSFLIKVEPGIDTEVIVDWYVDSSIGYRYQKHGEVEFGGSVSETSIIPGLRFNNIPETFFVNGLIQGEVTFSVVNSNSVIDLLNNGLNLSVDPSRTSENDIRFIINNTKISTNGIRVFVKNESGNWIEWLRAGTGYNADTSVGNQVFFVRINPDQFAVIEFGDGINWGVSPLNKEMIIIGLNSVGRDGNINKNTLSNTPVLSRYILGNDQTDIQFERSFVALLGLKSQQFFNGTIPDTRIIDSENTRLRLTDFQIYQNKAAFGGNEIETVDEIRKNATNFFVRQSRNVSKEDHQRFASEVFVDYITKVQVMKYKEIKASGLLSLDTLQNYWFNYLFLVCLNKDQTNVISQNLRATLLEQLNKSDVKIMGMEYEIVAASWIPIDVIIRYNKSRYGNPDVVETAMRQNISSYFNPDNHNMGDRIAISDIMKLVSVDNVESVEVMLNRDENNQFNANDYIVEISNSEKDPEKARRDKIMQLVAKDPSLVKVFQPVFSSLDINNVKEYNYSLDIQLSAFEFPKLGKIIIDRNVNV